MAGMRWSLVFLCLIIFTGFTAEGLCPTDNTPVIDLCEDKSFSGLGVYIDAAGMAADRSSCSCSVTSSTPQDVMYTSMLTNQSRNCQYYSYNVQLTIDNVQTWTCANPNGFEFTYERLNSQNPWYIIINKTESGVISPPDADPGYCLILVAVAFQPLNVVCGNGTTTTTAATTTATTPLTSTSSMTSTSQTSVLTMTVETTEETTTQSETTLSVSATTGLGGTSDTTSGGTTTGLGGTSDTTSGGTTTGLGGKSDTTSGGTTTASDGSTATSVTSSTQMTPGSLGDFKDTDTGVGVIAAGIVAGLTLFFLVALGCYFCSRYAKRKEDKEEDHDRHSVVTSTTNVAGYPYRQAGDRYVYYVDTSTHSNKDYLYLWS